MGKLEQKKQWHMGFYGAIELEFREDKDFLEFHQEYQLSKKPLAMDMLVVRKNRDVALKNSIGKLFRKHNIIEYKSPNDSLGIDQFFKGIAYICLYKSLGKSADEIKVEDLTLTFVRERYPAKLIGRLQALECEITEEYPGIYYVTKNLLFPVQIVVTGQLTPEEHLSLSILSEKAEAKNARMFLETMSLMREKDDRENIDAVLRVSVTANKRIYDVIKEENVMNDALRDLMKDEIEEGRAEGRTEGRLEAIRALMKNLKLSAEQAMESIGIPKNEYAKYLNML